MSTALVIGFLTDIYSEHAAIAWFFTAALLLLVTLVVQLAIGLQRHKRTAEALRSSENIQKAILEKAPLVLWAIDRQGIFTLSSGSGLKVLGLQPGQVVGKSVFDVYGAQEEICRQTRLALEGKAGPATVRIGPNWFEMHYATQYAEGGAITGAIGVARDVTEQVKAQEMHRRLAIAVEASVEEIVLTDRTGAIEYVNAAFERVTGYTRAEAIGKNPRILKSGLHDPLFYQEMWRIISSGKPWTGRFQNKKKDGRLYLEDATIAPLIDVDGLIQGYVAVKRDITAEVQMEDSLRQAQRTEAIGKLAGGIAHDFNNILQVIHTNVSFAKEPQTSPSELAEFLEHIQQATTRATSLTRQLLAFGRRQTLRYMLLDPAQVVADVLKLIHRTIGEHIQIELRSPPGIDRIRGDQGQLEQVLLNLCVNARDAMKGGGRLTIELHNHLLTEMDLPQGLGLKPGRYVELLVSDTGQGMDEATRARIFEPFFTTKPVGQGTGLGLPVVQGIVQQHGGHLLVDSTPGEGTRISVRIPSLEVREGDDVDQEEELDLQSAIRHSGHETVLLAEDDANVRLSVQTLLSRHGYRVVSAADGEEACQAASSQINAIDILVFDVVMPRLGGIAAAQRILKMKPTLPVILCSGYAGGVSAMDQLPDRSWKLVNKPYHGADLLKQLRASLDFRPDS